MWTNRVALKAQLGSNNMPDAVNAEAEHYRDLLKQSRPWWELARMFKMRQLPTGFCLRVSSSFAEDADESPAADTTPAPAPAPETSGNEVGYTLGQSACSLNICLQEGASRRATPDEQISTQVQDQNSQSGPRQKRRRDGEQGRAGKKARIGGQNTGTESQVDLDPDGGDSEPGTEEQVEQTAQSGLDDEEYVGSTGEAGVEQGEFGPSPEPEAVADM